MANENNNINELVADDDDPTVELRAPTFSGDYDNELEADANTFDSQESSDADLAAGVTESELRADLRSREKTIGQLQNDIEHLRSKWLGLEAEVGARDEQTKQLQAETASLRESLERKEKLIKKRDGKIKSMRLEIRQRDEAFRQLQSRYDDLQIPQSEEPAPEASDDAGTAHIVDDSSASDLQRRLERAEEYADTIRQQSQDIIESNAQHERAVENLTKALTDSRHDNKSLSAELARTVESLNASQETLGAIQKRHEEEIRILRFELGEAQDTVVETGVINSQLASDLVDAHGFKEELEAMLGDAEAQSAERIQKLEKEVRKLTAKTEALEQKLVTKSEAISVLLEELAKKSEHIESINEVEVDVPEVDERVFEQALSDDESNKHTPAERVTRVLIGTVDDQVLRFPLFKDRLTIGRTKNNDIQLKAAYVSRRHAVIQTDEERTRVIDWGSKNGIQVNSARVSEHFLQHGDVLTIGNAKFRYEERKMRDY